jgi:hypothetical protein
MTPGVDESGSWDSGGGGGVWGLVGGEWGGGQPHPYADDTDRPRPGGRGVERAEEIGAYALNMPGMLWNAFSYLGEGWTANMAFLNAAVSRGYSIYLATPASAARAGTYFWLELQYLANRGIGPAALPLLSVPH